MAQSSAYYRWITHVPPDPAPPGIMQMKGGERSLKDFKGQAVLLNLWATWCVPCIKELPTLDELEQQWGESGLVVLPLSVDEKPYAELRAFLDERKLALPHLALDTGRLASGFEWNALPTSFLINRQGQVIAHFAGATDWTKPEHIDMIQRALETEGW